MKYDKYKDSGVIWLGAIPEHWIVKKLKYLTCESLKYGANVSAELDEPNLPRYIRITDVDSNGNLKEDTFRSIDEDIALPFMLKNGDILLARSGATVGKSFIYKDSWGTCAYAGYLIKASINHKIYDPLYLYYTTKSKSYLQWIESITIQATIQNVSAEKYASLLFALPTSLHEQRAIATFLDTETSQIDILIEKKQTFIETLKEKRTSIISNAVTKGLKSDVKLKESNIEWLGMIPKNWNPKRLKFLTIESLKYGANVPAELVDPNLPRYVRITDVDSEGNLRDETFRSIEKEVAMPYLLKEGDILFARSGATVGKTFIYRKDWGECAYAGYLIKARINTILYDPMFIYYYTKSDGYLQWIQSVTIQATIQNVSAEKYASLWFAIPPSLAEQNNIVEYLNQESNKIDTLICKTEQAIDKLQEYKTALISSAVTGKIKVCE